MEFNQNLQLDKLLTEAIKNNASDLHLVIGLKPSLRIDKELTEMEDQDVVNEDYLNELVFSIISQGEKEELEKNKEMRLIYNFQGKVRCIINVYYQKGKPSLSIKIASKKIDSMQDLSLPPIFSNFFNLRKGLIIIAGPYYSGRSNTLVAFIEEINKKKKKHIVTLENTIESVIYSKSSIVEQREIGKDVNTLEDGLSYAKEADVDVLAILEMPQDKRIKKILELSEAMLVITVINADSVLEVIEKILMNFNSSEQESIRNTLTNTLAGISVQKLVPKMGGGLIPVFETMKMNEAIKTLIREQKYLNIKNLLLGSGDQSFISFDRSLSNLVRQGEVQFDVAYEEAQDKDLLQSLLRK